MDDAIQGGIRQLETELPKEEQPSLFWTYAKRGRLREFVSYVSGIGSRFCQILPTFLNLPHKNQSQLPKPMVAILAEVDDQSG